MDSFTTMPPVNAPDFRILFEQAPSPYLVLSPDCTILAANRAYLQRVRMSSSDILGKNLFAVFEDASHAPNVMTMENLRVSLRRVLQNKAPDTMPVQKYDLPAAQSNHLEEHYWSPVNTPVFDARGDLAYIIHRVEDVTQFMRMQASQAGMAKEAAVQSMEIHRANERLAEANEALDRLVADRTDQLRAEREYLHSLLMAVPVPVSVLLGPEHRYYLENDAHRQLSCGRELMGRTFREAVPDALDDVLPILDQVFQTGQPYQVERQRIVWDATHSGEIGEYYYDLSWHPLIGAGGKVEGIITATVDVTTQVRSNAAMKSVLSGLEQERALREQFVLTLTHDLRTPLAAAKMGAYVMSRKADDPLEVVKLTGRVVRNLDRIDTMIRDLLDANRIRAGEGLPLELERCELKALAADTLQELATLHGNRFTLQVDDEIEGYWCPGAIRRVLENLCGNAVKYGAPDRPITVTLLHEDKRVTIDVHNEGAAIPAEDQRDMFEPFRRNDIHGGDGAASHKGWGLGLTLVRGIAEAHGGTAEVKSSASHGTNFRITLPLDARHRH